MIFYPSQADLKLTPAQVFRATALPMVYCVLTDSVLSTQVSDVMDNHRISFSIDNILAKPAAVARSQTQPTEAETHLTTRPSGPGVMHRVLPMPRIRPYNVPAPPDSVYGEYLSDLLGRSFAPVSVNTFCLYPPQHWQPENLSAVPLSNASNRYIGGFISGGTGSLDAMQPLNETLKVEQTDEPSQQHSSHREDDECRPFLGSNPVSHSAPQHYKRPSLTYRQLVREAMESLGRPTSPRMIRSYIETQYPFFLNTEIIWKPRVRATLSKYPEFQRVRHGLYELKIRPDQ